MPDGNSLLDVLHDAFNIFRNQLNILFGWLGTLSSNQNHVVLLAAAIQTIAIVAIGYVAYRGVKKQIREHDNTAQRQATLSAIVDQEIHNPDWRKCKAIADGVLKQHKNGSTWAGAEHLNPTDRARRQQTLMFLNYYELIAIGIRKRAIHEDMYETWFKSGYIATWELSKEFVGVWCRFKNNNKLYANFKYVACQWRKGKHVQRRRKFMEFIRT